MHGDFANPQAALHEPRFDGNEKRYLDDCIDTGWVSYGGAYVERFEQALAQACGTKHAIAVASGTVALQVALSTPELGHVARTDCNGLIERGEVLFHDRTSVRHAYVVFDHQYAARRRTALGWMEERGIVPLGRFGRFEYDNSDQCVIKARELAGKLLQRAARGS